MKIITWNCQGAASKKFLRAAFSIIKTQKPSCFCILEPKMSGIGADEVCFKLGFDQWIRVEAVGMSGGIWAFWNNDLDICIKRTNPQYILMDVKIGSGKLWSLALVYGSPTKHLRRRLWEDLGYDRSVTNQHWIAMGDFNAVTNCEEVSSPHSFNTQRSKDFLDWIFRENLIDLGFSGPKFTWKRGNNLETFKAARLDRCLSTEVWLDTFPLANVTHLPCVSSDHCPILLELNGRDRRNYKKRFLFKACWSLHEDFGNVVKNAWMKGSSFKDKLEKTTNDLSSWSKGAFGDLEKRKRTLEARLAGIQDKLANNCSGGLIKLEAKLRKELEEVLYYEELEWYQRSREEWIVSGDRNTKYYHAVTKIRKATSCIRGLRNNEGKWVDNEEDMAFMIHEHFKSLFTAEDQKSRSITVPCQFPVVSSDTLRAFGMEVVMEEVKAALFDMSLYKAPGPDGYHAGFFQKAWDVVGPDLTSMVKEFFDSTLSWEGWNDTLLTLIPKVQHLEFVNQLRPISLCNVSYKVVTKIITNRLKSFLGDIIGEEQSSFIPGRQIVDNIVVYQEALHSMRSWKSMGEAMVLKIDLEKAYDRLSWKFIRETLEGVGLSQHWITIIMKCVETPRLGILWKGDRMEWIHPTRGLRQGDPISPYLFVLCIERLSHMIKEEVRLKRWKGIKLSRHGPELSHLFFADDLVLFAEASVMQMVIIRECLARFEDCSGQKVSLQKSQIFFSKNVHPSKASNISAAAGFEPTSDLGKYLGVPSIHGRVTRSLFTPVLSRIEARLESWKTRHLSLAGRRVLAQSVLNAIPYYTMQSILLPKGVCDEVEKRIRSFIWGKGVHLVNWDTVTLPKQNGGLGIRKVQYMNIAFLAKIGWRMILDSNRLWVKVLMAKYMQRKNNCLGFVWKNGGSNLWRGICESDHILREGVRKSVKSGRDTRFWKDIWIGNSALIKDSPHRIPEDEIDKVVADYWDQDHGWNWNALEGLISTDVKRLLDTHVLDPGCKEPDEVYWGKESSGKFSVSSVYNTLEGVSGSESSTEWDKVWKLKIPNKICAFIWLLKHKRIMTNMERKRKGLTSDAKCPFCPDEEEDIDHVLRKCPKANEVWTLIHNPKAWRRMLSLDIEEWLKVNLRSEEKEFFALAVWWIWKWRCNAIFKDENWDVRTKVNWIRMQRKEMRLAFAKTSTVVKIPSNLSIASNGIVVPGDDGWMALNTDASFTSPQSLTGCGGVMRSRNGEWYGGFSCSTKANHAAEGEAWAIYMGLKWAWNTGQKKVRFRSDSQQVVDWINKGPTPAGPCGCIIQECKAWIEKNWEVTISFVPRETNSIADSLAKLAPRSSSDWIEFHKPPPEIQDQIELERVMMAFHEGHSN